MPLASSAGCGSRPSTVDADAPSVGSGAVVDDVDHQLHALSLAKHAAGDRDGGAIVSASLTSTLGVGRELGRLLLYPLAARSFQAKCSFSVCQGAF